MSRPADGFPFAGYHRLLEMVTDAVLASGARRVLDLGTGTGNLLQRLAAARAQVPRATLLHADLNALEALDLPPVDVAVSTYVFHHWPDERKAAVVRHLLVRGVRTALVGVIAFASAEARAAAQQAAGDEWDAAEFYPVAGDVLHLLSGVQAEFTPVSFCAGLFSSGSFAPPPAQTIASGGGAGA